MIATREINVGRLGLDLVLVQLRHRGLIPDFANLKVGVRLPDTCGKILLIELSKHLVSLDDLIDIDEQPLDDAICLRFDLDFGRGFDLACGRYTEFARLF